MKSPVTWNRRLSKADLYSSPLEIVWFLIGTAFFAMLCLACS